MRIALQLTSNAVCMFRRAILFCLAVVLLSGSATHAEECTHPAPSLMMSSQVRDGEGVVKIPFEAKNLRRLMHTWRGQTTDSGEGTVVGSVTGEVTLNAACMTQAETFRAEGTGLCEGAQPIIFSESFYLDSTPQLTLTTSNIGTSDSHVGVNYWFRNGAPGNLTGYFYPAAGGEPILMYSEDLGSIKGGRSASVSGGGIVVVALTGCTKTVTKVAQVPKGPERCGNEDECEEGACTDCVGTPVHTVSRNMRYSEYDPLPGIADVMPFRRTYDSQSRATGAFGFRWASIFSASVHEHLNFRGTDWVSLVNEKSDQYLYKKTAGGYVQIFPSIPRLLTTLTRATDGSWTQYDEDRKTVRMFGPDGKPTRYRNVAAGRDLILSWTSGHPSRLDDSWGAWALLLTTDGAGRITTIAVEGRSDLTWSYVYDADNLIRVDSPPGTWRKYEYPWSEPGSYAHPLSAVRDGAGKLIESHSFDRGDALNSIQQTDDVTAISYPDPGRTDDELKRTVTYANGRVETYYSRTVAGERRIVEVDGGCASCGTGSSVVAFDDFGNVKRSQGANGYIVEREHDPTGLNVAKRRTALRPSDCDPATSTTRCRQTPDTLATVELIETDATTVTEYSYGDGTWHDRPTVIRTSSVLDPAGGRTETLAYDSHTGEVVSRAVAGWTRTGTQLRHETRTTVTTLYDGLAGAEFAPGGTFPANWLLLAQPRGFRRVVDGSRTDVADRTAYVYYPVNSAVPARLRGRLAAIRNARDQITRFEDYDLFGNALRVVDPNGVVTVATFDGVGRATGSTLKGIAGCATSADPLCATDLTTTRTYDGGGPLVSETTPDGGFTEYTYDARGRIETISRGLSANDLRERIQYAYDPGTGRKSSEQMLAFENGVWVEKRRDTFNYDLQARLQSVTHSDSTSAAYTYDSEGQVATVRDENHSAANSTYTYDPAGRLVTVSQTLASASGGAIATQYAYDAHGNLTSVTDPNGNVTSYTYDDFGQMLQQQSPVSGTTTYSYDLAGQLVESTDANGAATTRAYDALGRVTSSTSSRTGRATETVTWTYDDATAGAFGIGRLATMSDPAGATVFAYERRGLLRSEQRTFTGTTESYVTRFTYTADGHRASMVYPSGTAVQYQYDYAGRPSGATTGQTTLVSGTTYLPFGPATSMVLGNGTTRTMQYDTRYRMTENKLTAGAAIVAEYDLTWDNVGNVIAIADATDATYSRTFAYDDLNRLVTANTGTALWGTGAYTYDAMGNMLSSRLGDEALTILAKKAFFTYQGTTPKIATVRQTDLVDPGEFLRAPGVKPRVARNNVGYRTMTYDSAGNEVKYVATRTYSARNLLESVQNPGETSNDVHRVTYGYDGRGIRVSRAESQASGATATRYSFYSPEMQLLAVTNDDGPNVWARKCGGITAWAAATYYEIREGWTIQRGDPRNAASQKDFTNNRRGRQLCKPHWKVRGHLPRRRWER